MKTYLLLRNNRQTGPYTLAEILDEGLKPHDLVWVEGQSASWRYPSELDELKTHVPSPALDAPLEHGFSEVQNRVVSQWTGHMAQTADTWESPVTIAPAEDDILRVPIVPSRFPSMPPAKAFREASVPAFDALAELLPDEDLMPTIALQSASGGKVPLAPLDLQAGKGSNTPPPKREQIPATGNLPRVRVVLPAAPADKTMVVIRRRDQDGNPVSAPRSRSRRPVLEFMPEEPVTNDEILAPRPEATDAPAQLSNHVQAADINPPSGSAVIQPAENHAAPMPAEQAGQESSASMVLEPETADASSLFPVTGGISQYMDQREGIVPVASGHTSVAQTLHVNISMVQKIAVITAIISLLAVAALIANSIFNPNAYQYGTKPVPKTTEQVGTSTTPGTVKP